MVKIARAMAKRPIKNPESENTIQNQAPFSTTGQVLLAI